MTPKRTAERIEAVIQKANEGLSVVLDRSQRRIYNAILGDLNNLELDADGYIKQTAANRKIVRDVNKTFDAVLTKSGYNKDLSQYLGTINSIDKINYLYFYGIDPGFIEPVNLIKSLQSQAVKEIETSLLNEGLEAQIKQPLLNLLNQNINTGGSYAGMVDQVKAYVKGTTDSQGKLMRYSRQITQDTLNNYSRAYQTSIGESLGLEFYQYVGGLMTESREFCRDRVNGYFHYKEIESWAKLNWDGKNKLTTESSIFIFAGGHNCQHQILPVSTFVVPKDQLKRAEDLGFYKKAA